MKKSTTSERIRLLKSRTSRLKRNVIQLPTGGGLDAYLEMWRSISEGRLPEGCVAIMAQLSADNIYLRQRIERLEEAVMALGMRFDGERQEWRELVEHIRQSEHVSKRMFRWTRPSHDQKPD